MMSTSDSTSTSYSESTPTADYGDYCTIYYAPYDIYYFYNHMPDEQWRKERARSIRKPQYIKNSYNRLLFINAYKSGRSPPRRASSCGVLDCQECNTEFYTDAGTVQLMRKLEKWEHGKLFFACILYASNFGPVEANDDDGFVERYSITTTGLLADKVIEWRKNEKEKNTNAASVFGPDMRPGSQTG